MKSLKEENDMKNVQLILFPKNLGLKHRYIYRAPGIENIINRCFLVLLESEDTSVGSFFGLPNRVSTTNYTKVYKLNCTIINRCAVLCNTLSIV